MSAISQTFVRRFSLLSCKYYDWIYYLFFSEKGNNTGDVFAVLFNPDDRQRFQLSNMEIGQGIVVVKPQPEGEWHG